jgi:hypothetical protein
MVRKFGLIKRIFLLIFVPRPLHFLTDPLLLNINSFDYTMKKLIVIGLALLLCSVSCARERHYVKRGKPPSKKVIILPKKIDPSFRPYVINGQRYYPLPDSEGFSERPPGTGKNFMADQLPAASDMICIRKARHIRHFL